MTIEGKQETITAAALRLSNKLLLSVPSPGRHHTVIHIMREVSDYSNIMRAAVANAEQGFLTSSGRFVDREEGFSIAHAARQLIKVHKQGTLYSEDLW
jgi:hypothetical protein